MIYKPENGCMWDPSVLYHDGYYYMVSMYKQDADKKDNFMWMAKSEDGVHWESVGPVLEDKCGVCKMYIYEVDDGVAINFGSFSAPERCDNDTLRYYVSQDMVNWKFVGENHPDAKWYKTTGRWDHMYVYREDNVYYGYPVATPHPELRSAWGLCKSSDGYNWTCCPPPVIEWGDIPCIDCLEGGGMEKIGDKYYYIGGFVGYAGNYGYGLYTFTADSPEGPFYPDKEAFRLCGFERLAGRVFIQNLAAFARGKDGELLVSNAVDAGGAYEIWLLPLRKAVVDSEGHLRLGYWEGNEQLKGNEIVVTAQMQQLAYASHLPGEIMPDNWNPTVFLPGNGTLNANVDAPNAPVVHDRYLLITINEQIDLEQGIIFEGKVTAKTFPEYDNVRHMTFNWRPSEFGVFVEEQADGDGIQGMAITLEIGHPYKRYSHVEKIHVSDGILTSEMIDTVGEGCAEVRGIYANREVSFKLIYRRNVFELYADGLLVQTFVHLGKPAGRIGLYLQNAKVSVRDMKLYKMNL